MTALWTRARLPPSDGSQLADHHHHHHHHYHHDDLDAASPLQPPPFPSSILHSRHDYLHSLISGSRERGGREEVFGISLPDTVAVPGLAAPWSGRTCRSSAQSGKADSGMDVVEEETAAATMALTSDETAPSSPPGLSYSKSSKSSSSSVHSDSDLSDGGSADKLSRFEDVTIDDDGGRSDMDDSNLKPERRPTLKRPLAKSRTTDDRRRKPSLPTTPRDRDHRNSNFRGAANGVLRDTSLNLPNPRGMRRTFTTPPSSSFGLHGSQRIPSRSPSPSKPFVQNGVCVTPQALASATPRLNVDPQGPLQRRQSWQPGKKSVQELEAEYNDEDEDVPEEAILENVPISPLPGAAPRTSRSTTPSPNRRPPGPSHSNLHSANVPKNAKRPSLPTILPNGQYRNPRSSRHGRPPPLPHSATVSSYPVNLFGAKHRSKSWAADLSKEARELSTALEEYAERISMEKHGSGSGVNSGANSVASSPPRLATIQARAQGGILNRPPVQQGSVMIDPLPISKEKEAVLTRTRPSWLPPKCQKEEKKHMREWEQMMARAAENERKRALKEREEKESKEELSDSMARIWDQHVLPNWDEAIKEPRTRELWWRGVTPRSRGVVWQKAIGNELELSEASFEAARRRARDLEQQIGDMTSEERGHSNEATWFDAIARDVPTVYPDLDGGVAFQTALADVLKAYSVYRGDVGYVYGTHLIAGLLCLHLHPADAFVALANVLNRPLALAFLVHDRAGMSRAHDLVLSTLKYKFTRLHAHLTSPALDLAPADYLDPLLRCLFTYHQLPLAHTSRIWDIFVFEGDKALVRAAVAVLGRLEHRLYGDREEILDLVSWRHDSAWDLPGDEEDFVRALREAGKVEAKGKTGAGDEGDGFMIVV